MSTALNNEFQAEIISRKIEKENVSWKCSKEDSVSWPKRVQGSSSDPKEKNQRTSQFVVFLFYFLISQCKKRQLTCEMKMWRSARNSEHSSIKGSSVSQWIRHENNIIKQRHESNIFYCIILLYYIL